jgi:hypothetical protein
MDYKTGFPYVDTHYHPNGRGPTKWKRCLWKDVDKNSRHPSKNQNCFTTVQWFREATIPDYKAMEVHYCGFFFDFDAKPEDYDDDPIKALEAAIADVKRVINVFTDLDVQEPQIRLWYSGSKGFHLLVHPEVLGITPSRHNTYMMKVGARELAKRLSLKTLDLAVYSQRRMWRLVNSVHQTSGRFKIELAHHELNKGAAAIMDLAKTARHEDIFEPEEYENIRPEPAAAAVWERIKDHYENQQDLEKLHPTELVVKTDEWPACISDIVGNGLKKKGTRNKATMGLASYFKDVGMPKSECEGLLMKWVRALPDPESKLRERESNTHAVVQSVYESDAYHFSCGYIRSLSSGESKVACTQKNGCEAIKNNPDGQRPKEVPHVPLSKASEAMFIGKKVVIPVMITGKADSPYVYPKRVVIRCVPDPESAVCATCSLVGKEGAAEIEFQMQDQTLIDLINCTSGKRNTTIKRHAGVPTKCYANSIDVTEYGNLEEVRLQPDILKTGVVDSRPTADRTGNQVDTIDEGNYCQRLAYFVGHDIGINQKYEITAYVWGHPQNQKVCHLFDEAKAAQDDIDKFRMTTEIDKMLRTFQPIPGQTVKQKFDDIHDDLENNVHMIWQRREVAIAMDLVYHSVIGFSFQSQYERKGWLELLILGDSGNGKTKLVERMMTHYQLGEITGVEGGKRTGLIWANHNIGGRFMLVWGKIPQNDRRLIVLDEFSGMPDEEVATMTRLRTEGIAESQGINPAQTSARTRLVYLSNARNGKPLGHYNYGIEAVNKLFKEHQDVRRLDMAVCVQSGDVPLEVINKSHTPDYSTHCYTTALCKTLILWAWSRDPRQIRFTEGTEKLILKYAIETGKKYRCDVVLIEPSDQRIKIARMAAAVAARMYSTVDGQILLVKPEHVEFAVEFLQRCYDHKAMQYDDYAKVRQSRMFMTEETQVKLKRMMQELPNADHMVDIFLAGSYFRKGELADVTGLTKDQVNSLISLLSQRHCIDMTTGGYRKTPMFTQFLKDWGKIDNTDPPF